MADMLDVVLTVNEVGRDLRHMLVDLDAKFLHRALGGGGERGVGPLVLLERDALGVLVR